MCVGTLGGQGVKTQQNFEMIKGCYTLDSSKGGGPQTVECCQDGGQGVTDDSRCAYTEWHSFTQPRLGEVSAGASGLTELNGVYNSGFPKALLLIDLQLIAFLILT